MKTSQEKLSELSLLLKKTRGRSADILALTISSGIFSGFLPKSPGTWGSLAAVACWTTTNYLLPHSTIIFNGILATLIAVIGLLSSALTLLLIKSGEQDCPNDPQFIVIDEWAGMFISLLGSNVESLTSILLAFLLFRFFDIIKPGPIRWAENAPGEYGIMFDDVVAGFLALLFTQLILIFI